jgi:ribosomal protein S21
MTEVIVKGGDFEKALRQFKKLCLPILKELKNRRSFESKAQKRRRKSIAATRRRRKMERREMELKQIYHKAK